MHFGVDSRTDCFKLEVTRPSSLPWCRADRAVQSLGCSCGTQTKTLSYNFSGLAQTTAYNVANFRQPDTDGWGPKDETICKSLPHAAELKTTLPTRLLAGASSEGATAKTNGLLLLPFKAWAMTCRCLYTTDIIPFALRSQSQSKDSCHIDIADSMFIADDPNTSPDLLALLAPDTD